MAAAVAMGGEGTELVFGLVVLWTLGKREYFSVLYRCATSLKQYGTTVWLMWRVNTKRELPYYPW